MATTYQEEIKNFLELVPTDQPNLGLHQIPIQHKCSNDPAEVRQEVEFLRHVMLSCIFGKYWLSSNSELYQQDFNQRLKNVLFHSHNVAIVTALLPCCFAQV